MSNAKIILSWSLAYPYHGHGGAGACPIYHSQEAGYTLDWLPVWRRATHRETFTPMASLEWPIALTSCLWTVLCEWVNSTFGRISFELSRKVLYKYWSNYNVSNCCSHMRTSQIPVALFRIWYMLGFAMQLPTLDQSLHTCHNLHMSPIQFSKTFKKIADTDFCSGCCFLCRPLHQPSIHFKTLGSCFLINP